MSIRDVWGQCKHELQVCVQAGEHWGSTSDPRESDGAMARAEPGLLRVELLGRVRRRRSGRDGVISSLNVGEDQRVGQH